VRQCDKDVTTAAVLVGRRGGDPAVQVMVNGKLSDSMIWDSGASDVTLSSRTADALGLKFSDDEPVVEMMMADGRKIMGRIVELDSIRLGTFTVNKVEAVVLPPDAKAVDLLGDSFQKHFVCKLDQEAGQLQLTPIDSQVERGPQVEVLLKSDEKSAKSNP
jgi:clan AA aspartic protease (TIGR02281 family)